MQFRSMPRQGIAGTTNLGRCSKAKLDVANTQHNQEHHDESELIAKLAARYRSSSQKTPTGVKMILDAMAKSLADVNASDQRVRQLRTEISPPRTDAILSPVKRFRSRRNIFHTSRPAGLRERVDLKKE